MGYSSTLWGKEGWHFIHYVALNYPEHPTDEDKRKYKLFFELLCVVLPCPFCAVHFEENMAKLPIRLENSKELFEWTIDMHNEVNKDNGKPILSYEEALAEINKNSNKGKVYGGGVMDYRKIQRLLKNKT
jgi:hypothetical protein